MAALKKSDDLASWVENLVRSFIDDSPENSLQSASNEKAFESPLVGFSSGDDPLYEQYKELVGLFHWTPVEIFARTFPESPAPASELTVISWVLPHTQATKADNTKETRYPAERWARARIFGEEVNVKVARRLVEALNRAGYPAVAPMLSPQWEMKMSDRYVFASTWSERHAAHASGLGTFGLCDGLITARGKAMRVGSVVARIQIPPTHRPYQKHNEYCLFYTNGACRKCIARCPVDAVTEAGHDKVKCYQQLKPITEDYVKANFGFNGYGCGLCQTGVPCESRIPTARDV